MAILFDLDEKGKLVQDNEKKMEQESFWDNAQSAQSLIQETNALRSLISNHTEINKQVAGLLETSDELKQHYDGELLELFEEEYKEIIDRFSDFEIMVLLSHPYDKNNVILELHPGAGGTESQDWAQMLYRMYSRWAESKGYKVSILDYQDGEEAGIKSCSILIEGFMAYGYLKAEKGVHRLVRISPFDSSGRRHTSFASVDIMPQFNNDIEINIEEKDLEISTMRASGAGGQHVNTTDSAVRMVHLPTGIMVTCQTERSQIKNREHCLNMLKSKLYQRMIEEQLEKVNEIKGEQKAIEWGSQIRSYVFCPYTLVKDHRTEVEVGNVQKVMDGDLDEFIFGYLKKQL